MDELFKIELIRGEGVHDVVNTATGARVPLQKLCAAMNACKNLEQDARKIIDDEKQMGALFNHQKNGKALAQAQAIIAALEE